MTVERAPSAPVVGSLCTGYGGLDLGLALCLGTTPRHAWHVEVDDAPSKILARRFPGTPNLGDLKTLDYSSMERVDWLTAGYPCQPFSAAGKRLGEADARHLWPYIADAIGVLRPRHVLLENVRGHLRRGFDSVLADLAALGYDAQWGAVRASDAGAPHQRERIFVVATDARSVGPRLEPPQPRIPADARSGGQDRASADPTGDGRGEGWAEPARLVGRQDAAQRGPATAHAGRERLGEHTGAAPSEEAGTVPGDELAGDRGSRPATDWGPYRPAIERWAAVIGRPAPRPTERRPRSGLERLSPRFVEWLMGLPDGWVTDVDGLSINNQLKALGNGVVPQQAALAVSVLLHNQRQREVAA